MSVLPLVQLSGGARERGRQHGEALSDRVADNVALYRERMRADAGLTAAEIAERAAFYLKLFERFDSDYYSMMDGIAEGSGQDLADITVLNARFELLYSAWSSTGKDPGECTAFGAQADRTVDSGVWIGQNWDWFPGVRGGLLRWHSNDVEVLAYTEAGIAGAKVGVNSAGIGLCVNGLSSQADDWTIAGMPFHLRTSRILTSTSLHTAIAAATVERPPCSANFLIGSARSGVVDVESSPLGARRLRPGPGQVLVHANHFEAPELLGVNQRFHRGPVSTFARAARLEGVLNRPATLEQAHIFAALRDHEGQDLAVCRHPVKSLPAHQRIHTALSVLIDVTHRQIHYTCGPPCHGEYTTVGLAQPGLG